MLRGPLGEFLGTELEKPLARAGGRGDAVIVSEQGSGREGLLGPVALGVRVAVDDDVAYKIEEFSGAVAAGLECEEFGRVVDQGGGGLTGAELRVRDEILEEGDIGFDATDAELGEDAARAVHGDLVGLRTRDALHEQRVIERRDDRAGITHATIEAHAETTGRAIGEDAAVIGNEFVFRILGRNAALDRVAVARNLGLSRHAHLGRVEGVALGDENLGADQVETGDDFGDRMFNLDAWVHLDEEPFVAVEIVEEFDGAGIIVADFAGHAGSGVAEFTDDFFGKTERRSDLDDFLMAALDGAVALVEVNDVAVLVAEDLDLDVFRARDVFFEEDGGIAEGAAGFALGFVEEMGEIGGFVDDAHTATAPAKRSFDDEGEANLLRGLEGLVAVGDGLFGAGKRRHVNALGEGTGGGFVAHHFEQLGARPDEDESGFFTGAGEIRVLGEEAVAGVDGVHAVLFGGGDDAVDVEVGGDGALALADLVGLVGLVTVDTEAIFLRENCDRAEIQLGAGAKNPDRDLAAVGGHQLLDGAHGGRGGRGFNREG